METKKKTNKREGKKLNEYTHISKRLAWENEWISEWRLSIEFILEKLTNGSGAGTL